MARYPRDARNAKIKCVSCNAPVVETQGGEYVCVECGGKPVGERRQDEARADGGTAERDLRESRPSQDRGGSDGGVEPTAPVESEVTIPESEQTADPDGDQAGSPLLLPADSDVQPTISFVLPTKNEAAGIEECIDRAVNAIEELGLHAEIIVSDSSDDRTPELAKRKGAIIVEPDRKGYGYAYRYGFEHARGDIIVMGDADTTYDFEELPKLLEPIDRGEADIVLGTRLDGEIEPGAMPPLHRYVGNPLLTKFLNIFYDAGVSDAHSGFRVFTRDVLDTLSFESDGMEFASEMVMDASVSDLRIEEVPITYHPRVGEAELNSFQDGWRHVKFMLLNAPSYLFTLPGTAFVLLGALAMSLTLFGVQGGPVTFGTHTMIAGSLMVLVGYRVALLGVFNSLTADPIRRIDGRVTRWVKSRFSLEHGATAGALVAGFGGIYAGVLLVRWITSGFTYIPLVTADLVAFTAIVIGLDTLFSSFHLSAISGS